MILIADNLNKSFVQGESRLDILNGVSLTLSPGETVAIMGRSGCGKSTLLSLLAGLEMPSGGKITIEGVDLNGLSGRELNRFRARKLGIIFQQFHLLEHLTALENVRLPLDLNEIVGADQKAIAMLEAVGLTSRAQHFPYQMSRGECQRVAIARALVLKPLILFADEPTGSLDLKTGHDVMELILKLSRSEKFALLIVTHDPAIAARCARILYMADGLLSLTPAASPGLF